MLLLDLYIFSHPPHYNMSSSVPALESLTVGLLERWMVGSASLLGRTGGLAWPMAPPFSWKRPLPQQ